MNVFYMYPRRLPFSIKERANGRPVIQVLTGLVGVEPKLMQYEIVDFPSKGGGFMNSCHCMSDLCPLGTPVQGSCLFCDELSPVVGSDDTLIQF